MLEVIGDSLKPLFEGIGVGLLILLLLAVFTAAGRYLVWQLFVVRTPRKPNANQLPEVAKQIKRTPEEEAIEHLTSKIGRL